MLLSGFAGARVIGPDGRVIGRCEYLAASPDGGRIAGVCVRKRGICPVTRMLDAAGVKVFGDGSIVLDPRKDLRAKLPSPVGMRIRDASGTLMGFVRDAAFDETGAVLHYVVACGVYDDWRDGPAALQRCAADFSADPDPFDRREKGG